MMASQKVRCSCLIRRRAGAFCLRSGKTQQPDLVGSGGWPRWRQWFSERQHPDFQSKIDKARPPDPTISGCFKHVSAASQNTTRPPAGSPALEEKR